MREFQVIIERDSEGWYVGTVPGLPGCHTQARSLDELMERTREAISLYLEDPEEVELESLEFVALGRLTA